jgi:hypothetical protein
MKRDVVGIIVGMLVAVGLIALLDYVGVIA